MPHPYQHLNAPFTSHGWYILRVWVSPDTNPDEMYDPRYVKVVCLHPRLKRKLRQVTVTVDLYERRLVHPGLRHMWHNPKHMLGILARVLALIDEAA